MNRILLVVFMLAWTAPSFAQGTTNIRVSYQTHSYRIWPDPGPATGQNEVTIALSGQNQIDETHKNTGRYSRSTSRNTRLGVSGSDPNVTYRIINQNTIQSIRDFETYVTTITVRVSGSNCSASVNFRLKPGHKEYEAYGARFGTNVRFSSIRAPNPSCAIQ